MELFQLVGTALAGTLLAIGLHRLAVRTLRLHVPWHEVSVTLTALFTVMIVAGAAGDVTRSAPLLAIGLGSFFALKALVAQFF